MGREKYLSRLASPKSWPVKKKGIKWIAKPSPGSHKSEHGIHLVSIFRDMLGYAKTSKEVKRILFNQEIYVDGKRRKDHKFTAGLMDVIFIPKTKEAFRIIFTKKGKLALIKIDEKESSLKLCRIKGKTALKGKIQLNLYDGKNILIDKNDYKVGDTLLIEVPSMKIKNHFSFDKGSTVYLTGGSHIAAIGKIEEIKDKTITIKTKDSKIKTAKRHAFVVGKDKPAIKLE